MTGKKRRDAERASCHPGSETEKPEGHCSYKLPTTRSMGSQQYEEIPNSEKLRQEEEPA